MIVTPDWIRKKYIEFNHKFWGGKLPQNLEFKTSRSANTWGYARYRANRIMNIVAPEALVISNYYDSPEEVKINTLLHEMIHIADYCFHPEHFVRNGKLVSGKEYDAHGWEFFMPEANRINAFGYRISAKVEDWEKNESELSDREKALLNKKKQRGKNVIILHQRGKEGSGYQYCAVSPSMLDSMVSRLFSSRNFNYTTRNWDLVEVFLSHSEEMAKARANTRLAYTIKEPIAAFIEKNEMSFVKTLYQDNFPSLAKIQSAKYQPEELPKAVETPTPSTKEPKANTIPIFRWTFNSTSGRKTIELRDTTREEIFNKIKENFPMIPDTTINKIIDNKANYPMQENVLKISFKDIREMVLEAVDKILQSEESNNGNEIGNRRSIKVLNNNEVLVSIE